MRTETLVLNRILKRAAALAVLGVALGMSPSLASAETMSQGKADRIVANFDLGKCKSIDVNIYRCPAIDKPVCTSDYTGSIQCIRSDRKGRIIVLGPTPGMQ